MANPEMVKEWLHKMEYPNPNLSEEALKFMCRGNVSILLQQVITNIKPQGEVLEKKKNIICNYIANNNRQKLNTREVIEEIKLYNEKCKLEKELHEINTRITEKESSLHQLIAKIKVKNNKQQALKQKIKEAEKDLFMFKTKCLELDSQTDTCHKLNEDSKIMNINSKRDSNEENERKKENMLEQMIGSTLKILEEKINDFDDDHSVHSTASVQESLTIPSRHDFLTSHILTSSKKPLSSLKLRSGLKSTRKKPNRVETPFSDLSFSAIVHDSSTSVHDPTQLNHDSLNRLENLCFADENLRKCVDEVYKYGCENIFRSLCEFKVKHNGKISEFITIQNAQSGEKRGVVGLEELYAVAIQYSLKGLISKQEQKKAINMLNSHFHEGISDVLSMESLEYGLKQSTEHLENRVKQIHEEYPDVSEELDRTMNEIKEVESNIEAVQSKIRSNLLLLQSCSSWMMKRSEAERNMPKNKKTPRFYQEYELLKTDSAEKDVQKFLLCPVQFGNWRRFDCWAKIYEDPEFLEIIQHPYLSPENIIRNCSEEKRWLHQLTNLQQQMEGNFLYERGKLWDIKCLKDKNSYKILFEKLHRTENICKNIPRKMKEFEQELNLWLESPLNNFAAAGCKFENKTLQDYVNIYDSFYKLLK